jgi:hypothetical protein
MQTSTKSRTTANTLLTLCFATLLSMNNSATADPLVYEGFDYSSPSLEGQSGGTGWGLNWSTNIYASPIGASSLSYGSLNTSGKSVTFGPASATTVYTRQLASTLGSSASGGTLWVSMLYLNTASSTTAEARIGFYSGMIADSSNPSSTATSSAGTTQVVDLGRAASGVDQISLYNGSTIVSSGVATPRGSSADFLLLKFTLDGGVGTDTLNLWVNPDISLGEGLLGSAQASWTTANLDLINGLRFQTSTTGGFRIDEIRVGTTFGDVTVPEPSTAALATLTGMALLVLRKKRA